LKKSSELKLPWETEDEDKAILSQSLMEKIFALAFADENFTNSPEFSEELQGKLTFVFNDYVPIIMRLLEIDTNLAAKHAKISPLMNEELFWRNYYLRVQYLRAVVGMDGPELQTLALKELESKIIYTYSINDHIEKEKKKKSQMKKNEETSSSSVDITSQLQSIFIPLTASFSILSTKASVSEENILNESSLPSKIAESSDKLKERNTLGDQDRELKALVSI
jgi:hypothetical protein